MTASVHPVFLKARDLPDRGSDRPATVLEICVAAERISGQGSVVGAQQIGGLWRIYPATTEARSKLLTQGLHYRGTVLQLVNTNPFILRSQSGEEKPTTKVFIDNIPISVADSDIELSLSKAKCELRSSIKNERARDNDGKLTRFLTGRRFVFVTVPSVPLEKTLKVSFFTAKIYHKEQKLVKKTVVCSKCLEENHHASVCENEVVCRSCRKTGHKRGDAVCNLSDPSVLDKPRRESVGVSGERRENVEERKEHERKEYERREQEGDVQNKQRQKEGKNSQDRGRSRTRQTTLVLLSPSRRRSETPKRRLSGEDCSPDKGGKAKQAKQDRVRSRHHETESGQSDADVRG